MLRKMFSGRRVLLIGLMVGLLMAGGSSTEMSLGKHLDEKCVTHEKECVFPGNVTIKAGAKPEENPGNLIVEDGSVSIKKGDLSITGKVTVGSTPSPILEVTADSVKVAKDLTVSGNLAVKLGTTAAVAAQNEFTVAAKSFKMDAGEKGEIAAGSFKMTGKKNSEIVVTDGTELTGALDISAFTITLLVSPLGKVVVRSTDPKVKGNLLVAGDLTVTGKKEFLVDHPTDPAKQIVYVSLEGPEAGTYIRGTARLVNGEAVINLPEHFSLVTSGEGLTAQLTPRGQWLQLYVVQASPKQIIVREAQGRGGQFDYFIQGIRKGYEHHQVIRDK